jgi:hypothetical protein
MSILSDSILLEALEDIDIADMADNTVSDYFDSEDGYSDQDITDEIEDEDIDDLEDDDEDDDPASYDNLDDDDIIDQVIGGDF